MVGPRTSSVSNEQQFEVGRRNTNANCKFALASTKRDNRARRGQAALALEIDEAKLDEYLDALCEFNFAEWTGIRHESTPGRGEGFEAVGERMVERGLLQVKARLQQLERISLHL